MAAVSIKLRQSLRQRIDMDHQVITKYDNSTAETTRIVARKQVEKFRESLDSLHEKIVTAATDDEDIEDASAAHSAITAVLNVMEGKLWSLDAISGGGGGSGASGGSSQGVRLPQLDLPTFDGKYEEWPCFRDLFFAIITSNESLSGAQKLQYLKSSLKGDAERQVKSFAITDVNFKEAWDLVSKRYENTREIAFSLLRRIFGAKGGSGDSHQNLQRLHDTVMESIRSLTVMGRKTGGWDDLLVFIVTEKLDSETRKEWARELTGPNIPTFKELMDFLEGRIRSIQSCQRSSQVQQISSSTRRVNTVVPQDGNCACCGRGRHPLYKCSGFTQLQVEARKDFVSKHRLCFRCLSTGHRVNECQSTVNCRECQGKHNTLLHGGRGQGKSEVKGQERYNSVAPPPTTNNFVPGGIHTEVFSPDKDMVVHKAANFHSVTMDKERNCLMATAVVMIRNYVGNFEFVRVLLDSGATADVISESMVHKLGIHRSKSDPIIYGVGNTMIGRSRGIAFVTLKSRFTGFTLAVNALVMGKVTGPTPDEYLPYHMWTHLRGLELADPQYFCPGKVDMILGVSSFFEIILGDKVSGPPGTPCALKTRLGWIIGGDVPSTPANHIKIVRVHQVSHGDTKELIRRFWELEEVPHVAQFTFEEKAAEEHFVSTVKRNNEGRFVTSLPHNPKLSILGASKDMATRRLLSLERRLQRLPEYKAPYVNFMQEYLSLGHMKLLPPSQSREQVGVTNYLPHHFVLREESSTTKFRVVFDGSTPTSTGVSLNSTLLVGPKVQRDLVEVLLSFRVHPVAIKADLVKMFRQFLVAPADSKRLRILWRENPRLPIQEYELSTVTYGTASAPHTATRCLLKLAEDDGDKFPIGAESLRQDFYVDDLMTSVETSVQAVELHHQLTSLLEGAGIEIRKWDSNSSEVLTSIPLSSQELNSSIKVDGSLTRKVLGVAWNSSTDWFGFAGLVPRPAGKVTKRIVLSEMSRVFDPLGFVSPVTVCVKVFFQKLWLPTLLEDGEEDVLDWDDPIPTSLIGKWDSFLSGLGKLSAIRVPRCLVPSGGAKIELHGFSDASEQAYAAVVYVRCIFNLRVVTNIVAAKTRVAPTKQVSLPRLELCGALLLANLMSAVVTATRLSCPVYGWTDSEIVLRWVSSSSRRFSNFVANRVSKIQDSLPSEVWRYVKSEENPADCASRGVTVQELLIHPLWWNGPVWLQEELVPCFASSKSQFSDKDLEQKGKLNLVMVTEKQVNWCLFTRYSRLKVLIRVVAYCVRFISNTQTPKSQRLVGRLSCGEVRGALFRLIQVAQAESFGEELLQLKKKGHLQQSDTLLSLNPYIDGNGLLRVGGRLQKAEIPESMRHPLILPTHHRLTRLIVEDAHTNHLHAGFQLLWANLKREFWIPRARNLVRTVIRCCIPCQRLRAQQTQQLMGSLPRSRVTASRPFSSVGVDFAGPFLVVPKRGRGVRSIKIYMSLFVCFSSKAIHLEAVGDLTSEAFIACFRRFVARRGIPGHVHSDCGTNFVGANRELKGFLEIAGGDAVSHYLSDQAIQWHFNPPGAPHHGGLWEAGVKSAKFHLRRVMGDTHLTFEEFGTLLCQVEAALNSRPICALSEDPMDNDVLTPGHFLVGQPLLALPDQDVEEISRNRLSRWQRVSQMFQHFWTRWSSEYLTSLQQRHKWKKATENVEVGQLVLIRDEQHSPLQWRRGRVVAVHPGADGLVRVVTVKTSTGELKRPLVKVVPLLLPS